jgi:hypothetical protein
MSERMHRSQRKRVRSSMLRLVELRPDLFQKQDPARARRQRLAAFASRWWGLVLLAASFAVAIYGNCVAGP